jgi:hypothetical protein
VGEGHSCRRKNTQQCLRGHARQKVRGSAGLQQEQGLRNGFEHDEEPEEGRRTHVLGPGDRMCVPAMVDDGCSKHGRYPGHCHTGRPGCTDPGSEPYVAGKS